MIYLLLLSIFFIVGLFTIGGGYAMIPLMIDKLTKYNLCTKEELLNFIAISESTPGTFAINVATFAGYKNGGVFGGIVATLGLVLPSLIIIILIAKIFNNLTKSTKAQNILKGIRPVVIGLIGSVIIDLIYSNIYIDNSFNYRFLLIGLVCTIIKIIFKKVHPIVLVLIGAVLGIILY